MVLTYALLAIERGERGAQQRADDCVVNLPEPAHGRYSATWTRAPTTASLIFAKTLGIARLLSIQMQREADVIMGVVSSVIAAKAAQDASRSGGDRKNRLVNRISA